MRLAFVTPEYVTEPSYAGGLANYLGRLTTALADFGHDVHVFTRSMTIGEPIEYRGVTVHRVVPLWDRRMILDHVDPWIPRAYYNPYQDLKAAWNLKKAWKAEHKKQPFDLVQVANVMAVGMFFSGVRDVPVVTRLSSYRPEWDTAAGIEITRAVKSRWWMEKKAIRGTRFIYAPSHYVARRTEENYHLAGIQVVETPFFEDEVTTDDSELKKRLGGQPFLLFFGRMTQMKGVHVLVEALKRVLPRVPDMNVVFIGGQSVAPDGRPMHDFIREHLAEHSQRLVVLEPMHHELLYPFVKAARLVALPSLIDNLPNTCLEAMGMGRVVVATRGTCFEQLIEDGVSGRLVPPGDNMALAEAVEETWTLDDESLRRMGDAARLRIDQLRPEHAIPNLLNYYHQVIYKFGGDARARPDQPRTGGGAA